jgi:hypothetical protein
MKSVQANKKYHGNIKCACGARHSLHNGLLDCEFKPNKLYIRKVNLKFIKQSQLSLFNEDV